MKTKIVTFFAILPLLITAQSQLTQKQVREDFKILKSALTEAHPDLYAYNSKESWDSLFVSFEDKMATLNNNSQLFKAFTEITDFAKDGHLMLFPSPSEHEPVFFPLILKIIDEDFYTDTDDFDIPVGSKIISINNIKASDILKKLLKYAPADGYNLTKKYREIELKFGVFYGCEFGQPETYNIVFQDLAGKIKEVSLKGEHFDKIKMRNATRHTYASKYHGYNDKLEYFKERINPKEPFVYSIDSTKTAVLTVNSFQHDIKTFTSQLITIFKDIKKRKSNNLIIDIRQNIGGFRPNAINLFTYIANQPFKQRVSETIKTLELPEKAYVTRTYLETKTYLTNRFKDNKQNNYWKITTDTEAESYMNPNKNRFKGKVYVLTSGMTFSAASAFALNAKNNDDITLVGEETGGGYYFHIGEFPVFYQLPNSKITLLISLIKIEHFVKDSSIPKGSGVPPDVYVPTTLDDVISGKDSQLDYILNHIKK